jgi:large subunit ribosomal protein L16
MLFPKKVKFRKTQRNRKNPKKKQVATRGTTLAYGSYGLKAEEPKWVKSNQLEAARKAMAKFFQKSGKIWIRVFPDKAITQKPPEVGMGKGKGDLTGYVAVVKSGTIIFEVDGIDESGAKEALRKGGAKLPLRTRIISR